MIMAVILLMAVAVLVVFMNMLGHITAGCVEHIHFRRSDATSIGC